MNFNAMLVRSVLNNNISSLSMQQCYGRGKTELPIWIYVTSCVDRLFS